MTLTQSVSDKLNYYLYDLADPRTQDWWGVSNPLTVISILAAYLYFCKSLGPRLMRDREPFQLKEVLIVYNTFQVFLSLYLVYLAVGLLLKTDYSIACEPIDWTNSPKALLMANGAWMYYFAKLTELLDTVLFVLRKKFNQVSFLHVYHHTLMAFMVWFGVKYIPGGHTLIFALLNAMVHVIMYTYYLISGLGPQYQKYVWWKRHVTDIQLIQFVLIFIHNFSVFFYKCDFPRVINAACCIHSLIFMYLFGKFYVQSYKKSYEKRSKQHAKDCNGIRKTINKSVDHKEKNR